MWLSYIWISQGEHHEYARLKLNLSKNIDSIATLPWPRLPTPKALLSSVIRLLSHSLRSHVCRLHREFANGSTEENETIMRHAVVHDDHPFVLL
ncbi:Protein of unknown function [Pyronema omphalodes CBS 100304]|uniref:Uncharacterized protein n=1 Tax=Pyronema omphalodes (strain CBS 100304) TaxID=1076935 RepID=U4L083_PYROM|nr:Protein of unknown function [Pyronema omphalodes CBS 100304]